MKYLYYTWPEIHPTNWNSNVMMSNTLHTSICLVELLGQSYEDFDEIRCVYRCVCSSWRWKDMSRRLVHHVRKHIQSIKCMCKHMVDLIWFAVNMKRTKSIISPFEWGFIFHFIHLTCSFCSCLINCFIQRPIQCDLIVDFNHIYFYILIDTL